MNTTLEQNINDLTAWIKTTAQATQGFVTEQTPLYIKEYLNWYFWEAVFYASAFGLLSLILLIVGGVLLKVGMNIEKNNKSLKYEDSSGYFMGGILSLVFALILLTFIVGSNVHNAIKVKVAPRVVLVESITKKIGY